jgi:AraC family cel operon transcriptional repressor
MPIKLRLNDLLSAGAACHFATVGNVSGGALHDHDFAEVFWVIAGRGVERRTDGVWLLDLGCVGIVRPDDVHAFDGGEVVFRNLAFPKRRASDLINRYGDGADLLGRTDRRLRLAAGGLEALEHAAADLREGRRDEIALDRLLLTLIGLLRATPAARSMPEWLAEALAVDLIHGGVAALVEAAGRSPAHVARACQAHLGQTATQVVNAARLRRAARLLERSGRDITAVAHDSGFAHLGHFHRLFREKFGTTPRRYRERQRAVLRPDDA